MKKFFTQPIGEFSRQNSMVFLVVNIVALAANFELFDIDPVQNLINFLWGFSLFGIITSGYYLAEDHVPEYWKTAGGVLAAVILVGTFLEMTPTYQEDGFLPMYFFWALNQLIYGLVLRGTGIVRPVFENITILGSLIIVIGTGSDLFGYEIPESIEIVFLVGWVSLITGLSLGNYFAWGDKLSSSAE
tara:strand:- start:55 stop:618 length:564 start_codon:yes stop_codon:yes gene_type:complete